jgi:hypothetical protein
MVIMMMIVMSRDDHHYKLHEVLLIGTSLP